MSDKAMRPGRGENQFDLWEEFVRGLRAHMESRGQAGFPESWSSWSDKQVYDALFDEWQSEFQREHPPVVETELVTNSALALSLINARAGDTEAAREMMRNFCDVFTAGRVPDRTVLWYFASAFQTILEGDPDDRLLAGKALNLLTDRPGRRRTNAEEQRDADIMFEFHSLQEEGHSLYKSSEILAKKHGISAETVRRIVKRDAEAMRSSWELEMSLLGIVRQARHRNQTSD